MRGSDCTRAQSSIFTHHLLLAGTQPCAKTDAVGSIAERVAYPAHQDANRVHSFVQQSGEGSIYEVVGEWLSRAWITYTKVQKKKTFV